MTESAEDNLFEQYQAYLNRFDAHAATPTDVGAFVKYKNRLIKKMRYDEFSAKLTEYHRATRDYYDSLDHEGTIDDMVTKTIRDRAGELLLDGPV